MNIQRAALPALLCMLMMACSPEEPLINSFDDRWRLVISNQRGEVVSIPVPANEPSSVIWSDPSDSARHGLHRFRDRLYLLHSIRPWIVVFDADTVRAIDTIDLGSGSCSSIAFANATTAFAVIPEMRNILVIDLTVNSVASTISTPSRPMHIAANGNQLCVSLPDTNAVAILDSRTLNVEHVIATADVPWFVESDPTSSTFCIVGLGSGKVDANPASAATLQFLDATTRKIGAPLEIATRSTPATQMIPTGLCVTPTQIAYIATQAGLFRTSTRTRSRVSTSLSEKFTVLSFNEARTELIGQVSTTQGAILVYNGNADAMLHRIAVSSPASSMVGIPR